MDLQSHIKFDKKADTLSYLYDKMPKYLSSKHRVHRMFFKKCDEPITTYQNCIEDPRWKSNIDKYINESMRRKCYNEWVQVRRCAIKNVGDTFAMKINMSRQVEDDLEEERMISNYKVYYENKKFIHRWEKVQGPPSEEEAAEGGEEAEEEAAEEESAEDGSSEDAGGEENPAGQEESATEETREVPIVEDDAANAEGHPEIKAAEESGDE